MKFNHVFGYNIPYIVPKQMLRIMKLIIIMMTTFLMQVSASGYAQRVTLNQQNLSLKEVFTEIRKQTGYTVLYRSGIINYTKKITLQLDNVPLEKALIQILDGQKIDFLIKDKAIILNEKKIPSFLDKVVAIFNTITIKGKVIDENGKPLSRATIRNKAGTVFTYTNDYGEFTLANVEEKTILTISFLGYENKEVAAVKEMGTIQLIESSGKLQEVVISTGYQQIDKSQMTGSAAKVKAEDLVVNGTNTIEQMLQGKLAGVDVVNNSGVVGTRQTVRVRGTSTLLGNQEPIWVVDGIIQEDPLPFKGAELNRFDKDPSNASSLKAFIGSTISWLNPYDIEDITVLKDAASTAIYGVKAANGVIVINTKRGKTGRAPSFTYNTSFSTQAAYSYDNLNLMNSAERVDVSREVWERGLTSSFALQDVGFQGVLKQYLSNKTTFDSFNSAVKQLEVNNTDWLGLLFQSPLNQSHNFSVSGGGSGGGSYYGSFGYNNQKGAAIGNGQQSYTGSVNFTSNLTKKLSVSAKISGNLSKTTGFNGIDPYKYATTTSRVIPAYNPDGSLSYYLQGNYRYNVFNELENSGNENTKNTLNANLSLRYELPLGLRYESLLGVANATTHGESYASDQTNQIASARGFEYGQYGPLSDTYKKSKLPLGGELATVESRNFNYTWRNSLNFGKVFNSKHAVSGMMGLEFRSNQYQGSNVTTYGYLPDRGKTIVNPPLTIQNGTGTSMVENTLYSGITNVIADRTANYISYYLTGGYTYDERYVFSLSLRGDASNRFGQDTRSRFSPVWALGGRWNVAREHWFDKTDWFNDFSIRTSYGFQGNVAENYGPDLIAKMGTINTLTGEPLLNVSTLPYSNLRKEKTQTADMGLDFSFFKNRITASVDYYNKKSTDLIVLVNVPSENGVQQMPMNGGDMSNSGLDLAIGFVPLRNKNVTWSLGMNMSRNYNKVTSTLVANPSWNNAISGSYYVDGYAVSSFWVFANKGLNHGTGTPEFNIPTTAQNPNAKYNATSYMAYGGKLNADFTGGFNTSLRYKEFTFSTSLYLSLGGNKILAPLYSGDMVSNTPNEYNNLSKGLVNRWRQLGDEVNTNIPSLPSTLAPFVNLPTGGVSTITDDQAASYSAYTLYNFSSQRVVNASYLRISTISLNYMLPDAFCKRILTKSVSVGYSISNPYTFVSKDFKGVDPEVASGSQPIPCIHALSLSVTF